ncbi:MAG: hypothetical protein SFU91_03340 [Chloroherpetonaceae bacterium]|nr:hypothetical protein [Chloroherpetonaceae bacterium]
MQKFILNRLLNKRLFLLHLHFVAAIVFFSLTSCSKSTETALPLMQIGQSKLFREELELVLKGLSKEDSITQASLYIEDWKMNAILYEAAIENEMQEDTLTKYLIEKMKRRIVVQQYVDKRMKEEEASGRFDVDSIEAKAYYEKNAPEFTYGLLSMKVLRLYAQSESRAKEYAELFEKNTPLDTILIKALELEPELGEMNNSQRKFATQLLPISKIYFETASLRTMAESMVLNVPSKPLKLADTLFVVMTVLEKVTPGSRKSFQQAYPDVSEQIKILKEKKYMNDLIRESLGMIETK